MTVTPYDEQDIADSDLVLRRINPEHHVVWDDNFECSKISSKAFSPSSGPNGGLSVDILKLIEESEENPQEFVTTPTFTGCLSFSASAARSNDMIIGYEPIPANPYHGEVWNNRSNSSKFSKQQKKALLNASTWFVSLPKVTICP